MAVIERYFIRSFGSSQFVETQLNEFSYFNIIKNYFRKNELIPEISENSIEFCQISKFKRNVNLYCKDYSPQKKIQWRTGKTVYNHKIYHQTVKLNFVKNVRAIMNFQKDDNGASKDIFLIKETADFEQFKLEIDIFTIDRKKLSFRKKYPHDIQIPYKKSTYSFDLYNGKFSQRKDIILPFIVDIPSKIKNDFFKMRDMWAGKELSLNSNETGIYQLKSFTEYPYEPNFSQIKLNCTWSGIITADRNNPNAFRDFCSMNNIQNTKTLRKLFMEDPVSLVHFKELIDCGFKNLDIIFAIIKSRKFKLIYGKNNDPFLFFMKYCLKHRDEKAVWNLFLQKDYDAKTIDILEQFLLYFNDISEIIKHRLIYEGFSDYTYTILKKCIANKDTENYVFTYSKKQENLEDKIDGYDFKLPKDYKDLYQLGEDMDNCVATYQNKIASNISTIVYAEKKGKKCMCIEIRNDSVIQKFAPMNQPLKKNEFSILEKWVQNHNLMIC